MRMADIQSTVDDMLKYLVHIMTLSYCSLSWLTRTFMLVFPTWSHCEIFMPPMQSQSMIRPTIIIFTHFPVQGHWKLVTQRTPSRGHQSIAYEQSCKPTMWPVTISIKWWSMQLQGMATRHFEWCQTHQQLPGNTITPLVMPPLMPSGFHSRNAYHSAPKFL